MVRQRCTVIDLEKTEKAITRIAELLAMQQLILWVIAALLFVLVLTALFGRRRRQ